jgi:hypothetical protein
MPAYTLVTTTATQGTEAIEVSTLSDDFANESEAMGYSRRMAEEMVGFAINFPWTSTTAISASTRATCSMKTSRRRIPRSGACGCWTMTAPPSSPRRNTAKARLK